ncbi:tRNA lysidine(34) synthetase TilS [Oscillospiraceae bacterium LTW-04]|nr:tRNA lysidine(34) synthetase TilS [Oscillospiraceae bacterium MB24-C1]
MKDSVLKTIQSHHMLKQGENVIVGLSGGADSVALLCVLYSLKDELRITLSACHINHNLRGEESLRDERFCGALCSRLGISLVVKNVDVLSYCAQNGCGTEEGARDLRYQALQSLDSDAKIATAHTLSDNAETLLMNLTRGAALEGLCGIPPVRNNIIRPLINCTRDEVEEYLKEQGQDFVTDSTNHSNDYKRNRIRHTLIPLLKALNPSFEQAVRRTVDALQADKVLLGQMTAQALAAAAMPETPVILPDWAKRLVPLLPRRPKWSRAALISQPKPVRLRCYKEMLLTAGQRYDADRLALVDELVLVGSGGVSLDGCNTLRCDGEALFLETLFKPPRLEERQISLSETTIPIKIPLNEGVFLQICEIDITEIKFFVNNRSLQFKNAIDCDRINEIITLRPRAAGDRIALVGHNCTQSLKKLLNAMTVPALLRDGLAVLSDEKGPVWIEGLGVSERAAISRNTRRAVLIRIQEE